MHNGFIPNHRGGVEESWFLVLACSEVNGFATVSKVNRLPVGETQVRVPLTFLEGPTGMAAYSHGLQAVDLNVAFDGLQGLSYVGAVAPGSLIRVFQRVVRLTRL